jgi:hypothetical protein
MRSFITRSAFVLSIGVALPRCAEPIDAPSAFTEEQFLCDAEHIDAFNALVAACRDTRAQSGSCAGYLSFRGTVDSQPVVLDSVVTKVDNQFPVFQGVRQNGLIVWSSAPYFDIRFSLVDRIKPGSLQLAAAGESNVDFVDIVARGGNYLTNWSNETRTIEIATEEELRFTFSTDLSRGGHLDGCLDIFPPAP